MTLYARSDVAAVIVPAESGGCGLRGGHARPVINGAPQHPWGLACAPCEDYLRVHMPDHWSSTTAEIPETHDEKLSRENFEKRGAKDKDAILTLALARLAGIDSRELPESLTRMISGVPAHLPAASALLECPSGHLQQPGQRFCGECGQPMSRPVPAAAVAAPEPPPAPSAAPVADARVPRMRDGRIDALRAFAEASGLDGAGTRADLISRLSNAGLTGKWAAFAAPYYAAGPVAA